ncbi:IclR family transcriptional regulator [Roseomonas sp. CCTCC AB2023176]|uniref:IclR family transcriptional regulator n=1 Tax=Roseomonas sp. CCTCC AB2023176 TaxID=3342640 RepID=UPI0035DED3D3
MSTETPYAAPALEKGLDILEALAASAPGLTQNELAQALDRSVGEIFRMVEVLRRRGWVIRDPDTGRHTLSTRLFELAHRHPPTRRLLDAAVPELGRLADVLGQSAHLSIRTGDRLLVLAVAEGFADMGFSVRLGSTYPFAPDRSSALVIAAFGDEEARVLLLDGAKPRAGAALTRTLDAIRTEAGLAAASATIAGVTDLCCPVLNAEGVAVAALVVPFLERRGARRRKPHARQPPPPPAASPPRSAAAC